MEDDKKIIFIVEPDKPMKLARLTESEIESAVGGIGKKVTLTQTNDLGSVLKLLLADQTKPNPLCRVLHIDGKKYPIYGTFAVVRENIYGEIVCIKDVPLPLYRTLITPIGEEFRKEVAAC